MTRYTDGSPAIMITDAAAYSAARVCTDKHYLGGTGWTARTHKVRGEIKGYIVTGVVYGDRYTLSNDDVEALSHYKSNKHLK